ncbi:MAG: DNA methyltransferase, partial [Dactylosporangium sp.]|nr:DNA methyltransferase [Dactylosporangium sp.]
MPGAISEYLSSLRREYEQGNTTEHSFRPALKAVIEAMDPNVIATNEPQRRVDCGAPDISVARRAGPTIGYVEAKDIGTNLSEAERTEQLQRYLRSLPNLILTDQLEFRWYVDGELRKELRVAHLSARKLRSIPGAETDLEVLLQSFLSHRPEPIRSPEDLARRMARLTHLIRDIIVEAFQTQQASDTLHDLRKAFEEVLIPDLTLNDFADMFAQTLAYGLFAARINHKGSDPFERVGAARDIPKTNPFLRKLFDTITGVSLDDEPFARFVDDLTYLLANADMAAILADFGKRTRREDPIVHFYETFLAAYDPKLREQRGVYYTPMPVVSYIVRSVDHLLRERFGCQDGLADAAVVTYKREVQRDNCTEVVEEQSHKVLVLDPACGTGTFLYAVIDQIRNQFMERGNAGLWSGYVREHLLPRLFGFEVLMAPYAVAHLKLGMQLAGADLPEEARATWAYDFAGDERLGVYLTNALEPGTAEYQQAALLGRYIADEAQAASKVKSILPVLVILGNPPYSGHSANKGSWISQLLRDYYTVDGRPLGERNTKWLQNDYVKFIRFAQWRIQQTGSGILAFITDHGFLRNPTFRGMRHQLISAFSDIYVLDLHGGSRKQELSPDGTPDENVFDIQQGVSIAFFVRDGSRTGGARVY